MTRCDRTAPSILIVDDTPANLNLLCGVMREQGYRARPVPSGELALQAAAASPPDLILLDVDMPELTGFEVCERLKSDPALSDIPVIFITALTDVADKVKGFTVGGVDYITKPFQLAEVNARVATHLELRRQRGDLQESCDKLRALEALRDSLVHMLVHDLRAPLTALTGSLDLFMRDAAPILTPSLAEDLEHARKATKRMALMVDSVLDVNKLEAGKMTLNLAECDAVALVREVVEGLGPLAGGRAVTIIAPPDPVVASLDRGLVHRVVQNLVANALQFAPAEGGCVDVEVGPVPEGLQVRVTDNGRGLAPEHHRMIFEKFGQVHDPSVRRAFSTGLGLPFCKLAVEAHGGRIGVESGLDRGATFWFALPREPSVSPSP